MLPGTSGPAATPGAAALVTPLRLNSGGPPTATLTEFESPLPVDGLNTRATPRPVLARSAVVSVIRKVLPLTTVALRSDPFQRTIDAAVKLLPASVSVVPASVAVSICGATDGSEAGTA